MNEFTRKHHNDLCGTLSGFDRLRFQASLRMICFLQGMTVFLQRSGVLLKDFGAFVENRSKMLKAHLEQLALQTPVKKIEYLKSSKIDKEKVAQLYLKDYGTNSLGQVVWLSCQEGCRTFSVRPNGGTKLLELRSEIRRCLHYYLYFNHPQFGWMHIRLQSWFPFSIHICLNGREWLARQMDNAGLLYSKSDNTFTWVQDFARAQELLNSQLELNWSETLNALIQPFHPKTACQLPKLPDYFWSVQQSEWATDLSFRSAAILDRLFPRLVYHGIQTFHSPDVLRFLGQKVMSTGKIPSQLKKEIRTTRIERLEGVCIKHALENNSVKLYNKAGSNLRVETTIQNPTGLKVYRPKEGDPEGPRKWRPLRKGVADLHRCTDLSQASNDRCLTAYTVVESPRTLAEVTDRFASPAYLKGRRHRALRLSDPEDVRLLEAITRGAFLIQGFRNRDLQAALYPATKNEQKKRQRCHQVTRLLKLLRAHKLVRKVSGTHRYHATKAACECASLIHAARAASVQKLTAAI